MRQIKFRAWDKSIGKMRYFNDFYLDTKYQCLTWKMDDESKGEDEYYYGMSCQEKDLIIMQFTGLLDKMGKEIWEGDLIHCDAGFIWEVCFESGEFYLRSREKDIRPDRRLAERIKHLEVIGNIYENPELIK